MDDNVGVKIAQVARLLRRSFDERARSISVTRPQWQVLSLLARNLGINQGGLADILEVEPITLGRMIDRLQDASLVERRADPADRRAWKLFLTPRGAGIVDQLQPLARETFEEALDGVDPAQRMQLMDTLDKMLANLSRRSIGEAVVNG